MVNLKLARCLPAKLALRHHALPVAKEKDHITVAMANPDDEMARQAIEAALGSVPYIVQGDRNAIDSMLAAIWNEEAVQRLRMLVYVQNCPAADEVMAYGRYLMELSQAQLECGFSREGLDEPVFSDYDLVVFGEANQSLLKRMVRGPAGCEAVKRIPASILIARHPQWPLQQILLVSRGHETDQAAVDWAIRLARPSGAGVTVLAVIPEIPANCSQAMGRLALVDWLRADTPLGDQIRQMADLLANWEEVEGHLRFREGTPLGQIEQELGEIRYDLVIITADPARWWQRRVMGELVGPLLRWWDGPVLVVRANDK